MTLDGLNRTIISENLHSTLRNTWARAWTLVNLSMFESQFSCFLGRSCVALRKLPNFPVPQLPLQNEITSHTKLI